MHVVRIFVMDPKIMVTTKRIHAISIFMVNPKNMPRRGS
jgi:hypothetical protein